MASWLSGPRAAAEQMGVDLGYRGERLGLPRDGAGSLAGPGRRIGALAIDWALCMVIAYGLFAADRATIGTVTLLIFVVMAVLLVGTIGTTPGKRLVGLRVVAVHGQRLTFPRAALRTLLLALAVPALIWDRDLRGLHDRISGAVQIRI